MKRKLLILCLALLLFASMATSAYAKTPELNWFCRRTGTLQPQQSREERLIVAYNGYSIDRRVNDTSDKKVVYLTFDAGYSNENVISILDTMRCEGVHGAFFLLTNFINKNPDLVNKMIEDGHLMCNHTSDHKNLCAATKEEIKENLERLEKVFYDKTGRSMTKYFRFPEGKYSEKALASVSELGYKSIFWSFAYDDWDNGRQMSNEAAIRKIINNTHNGAVMLFHPTSKTNAEIFPELIKCWRNLGYTFGTLDELTSQ